MPEFADSNSPFNYIRIPVQTSGQRDIQPGQSFNFNVKFDPINHSGIF